MSNKICGPTQLREWMDFHKWTLRDVAAYCETTHVAVYYWVLGTRTPSAKSVMKLAALTDGFITIKSWFASNSNLAFYLAVLEKRDIDLL